MRLLILCAAVAFGQQQSIVLTPADTHVDFKLGATGHTVYGSFPLKRGSITYDPESGKASGEIVLDTRGAKTGNDSRDKKMHKDVLESETFPEIVFLPDRIETSRVHGIFRLHGTDHEMTVPIETDQLTVTARFIVPYVEWGMKNPGNLILHVSDK